MATRSHRRKRVCANFLPALLAEKRIAGRIAADRGSVRIQGPRSNGKNLLPERSGLGDVMGKKIVSAAMLFLGAIGLLFGQGTRKDDLALKNLITGTAPAA